MTGVLLRQRADQIVIAQNGIAQSLQIILTHSPGNRRLVLMQWALWKRFTGQSWPGCKVAKQSRDCIRRLILSILRDFRSTLP